MATKNGVKDVPPVVLVDAGLVLHKRLVDNEATLNRAVGHDLHLNVGDSLQLEGILGLVASEGLTVDALGSARGSNTLTRGVGEAGISDDTVAVDVLPRVVKVATLAAHISLVAGDHVLRRQDLVDGALGRDGKTIAERYQNQNEI